MRAFVLIAAVIMNHFNCQPDHLYKAKTLDRPRSAESAMFPKKSQPDGPTRALRGITTNHQSPSTGSCAYW